MLNCFQICAQIRPVYLKSGSGLKSASGGSGGSGSGEDDQSGGESEDDQSGSTGSEDDRSAVRARNTSPEAPKKYDDLLKSLSDLVHLVLFHPILLFSRIKPH